MTIVFITVAALILVFLVLVVILKIRDDLTWKAAFREAIKYIFLSF